MKAVYPIISGILYAAAFPKWDFNFLIFIAFVPLLFGASKLIQRPKKNLVKSFFTFFLFGLTSNICLLYWIPEVMVSYGNAPYFLGILALILLSALLAIFPALGGILIVKQLNRGYISVLTIPAIWVFKDYILEWVMTGFPWCPAGYSQYSNLKFIQLAEYGGVHLISFIILAINTLLFISLKERNFKGVGISILIVLLNLSSGSLLTSRTKEEFTPIKKHRAAILQPNYSNSRSNPHKRLNLILENSSRLKNNGAEFIVWPEYTVSIYPAQNKYYKSLLQNFASTKAPIIAGFTDYQGSKGIFNSIFLFTGKDLQKYDKTHLVPFGEYIPLRKLFFFISKITDEVGDFSAGKEVTNLHLLGHKIATPICYEIIFPELVRDFVNRGAELIVTCSNDSWYGLSSAPGQLLAMSVFRSVENRRYNIRAASTGISAFISPSGDIIDSIPLNTSSSRVGSISFIKKKTLFTRIGYHFPWVCLILYLATLPFRAKTQKKKRKR